MINNTMHDELTYRGSSIIIDTCDLGEHRNNRYETMALYKNTGMDLECVLSASLEDAQRVHALMLEKYKGQEEKPLEGKYARLRDDLIAAYEATEYLEETEDGGTCNFDAPVLHLERWDAKKIKQAAKEAGGGAFKWTWGRTSMGWVFSTRSSGQANRRTRRAEAIRDFLKERGYNTGMYYAMD